MTPADCRRLLAECVPDLAVTGVRYLAEGWDSTVFEVNDTLVFRFPKRPDVAAQLERERRLLPELAPVLPAPIPRFRYVVDRCPSAPFGFAGYPKLPGEQLCNLRLPPEQTARLAEQAGRFLAALHGFPVARARELGIEAAHANGGPEAWRRFVSETLDILAPALAAHEHERLRGWFARVEGEGMLEFTPVLTHADLGDEHLLVDPATGDLLGVIDFGDAGIGDPASDFTGLLVDLGEGATRLALAAYGRPNDEALMRRAARYGDLSPVHEARFGLTVGDAEHTERGLERLRAGILAP